MQHILINDIASARRERGQTQAELAKALGVDRQAIMRIEAGVGSFSLLLRMMVALDYHLVGLARGKTLSEQIGNRRRNLRLSKADLADRAGVTRTTVSALEGGRGSVASLMKVLGFLGTKAMRRRKPQMIPLIPINSAERDKRFTPEHFLDVLDQIWGSIDIDPCAHPESPVRARRLITLQDGGDGLRDDWSGRLAFVNPPFSRAISWLQRADEMWSAGKVEIVVALVPARTDGNYFHDRLSKVCDIALLRGRFHFSRGEGQQDRATRAPFPLMVVIWGANTSELAHFERLCSCVWIARDGARHRSKKMTVAKNEIELGRSDLVDIALPSERASISPRKQTHNDYR
ncbi:DNA N-6-adenine-methyltransferase [Novosphingobium indicum]|uniref:DNA N-6-adenine-methyltransferase n=1 Tax=Novosphingobium indicum TaxID=462949 RepID=UPI0016669143|nr:DNA N-6-adenine-methyltransferase [Novosphingobium indicum]